MSDGAAATGARRSVIALGGNAIAPRGTAGTAAEQEATITAAMDVVAGIVAAGRQVVITHGNGPQVGNLLTKNELARHVVPAVPLYWCVANVQATIGLTMLTALDAALRQRGIDRMVVPLVSRVVVRRDDPAWQEPTKPIGRYVSPDEAAAAMAEDPHQVWHDFGRAGWRRVVPSPEPVRSVEIGTIRSLIGADAIVIANGGGGVPYVEEPSGALTPVEAVVDKDLAAAVLAAEVDADDLVILTDVEGVAVDHGGPTERWLDTVDTAELRALQAAGTFGEGSMAPKVEAVLRFVESTGRPATIGSVDRALDALAGQGGTRIVRSPEAATAR